MSTHHIAARRGGVGVAIVLACLAWMPARAADIAADASKDSGKDSGKLLIMGGNIGAERKAIYAALVGAMKEGGTLGIFPTAGEGAETEPGKTPPAVGMQKAMPSITVKQFDVTTKNGEQVANDPELAKQVAACDAIFFNGGAQSRVLEVFRPHGKRTLISDAVDQVLAKGGVVSGSSAGAAIMSDPMIMKGDSAGATSDLAKAHVAMGAGMGYFKFGIVDQHFLQRGRLGRLVIALEQTKQNFGFGISEARAILVDRAAGTFGTIGKDAVVFVDRRNEKIDGPERTGVRVSLIGSGDAVDAKTGEVTVSNKKAAKASRHSGASTDKPAAWDVLTFSKLIHGLASGTDAQASAYAKGVEMRFSVDDQTKFFATEDGGDITVLNLRLDVLPYAGPVPSTLPTTAPATAPAGD